MAAKAQMLLIAKAFDRAHLERIAEWLALAVAVSLPWSTSATGILIALWLLAFVPTLDVATLRRDAVIPAVWLPVALWVLGLVGMLWADASFAERLAGFRGFHKLLVIPLLVMQFRRSDKGMRVVRGFLASCTALLVLSWALKFFPALWPWPIVSGAPVKDYIIQSAEFLICAFAFGHLAFDAWHGGRRRRALGLAALALVFLASILFVAAGRTVLVVFPVLLFILGFQRLGGKGAAGILVAGAVLTAIAWASSPYLRARVLGVIDEVQSYRIKNAPTSSGYRLEFWKKSIEFIAAAPIIGHGTGSTPELFRRAATGDTGASAAVTGNPHNVTLEVAVQIGLVGVVVLYAMWIAHLMLFGGSGLTSWLGFALVVQTVVSSLFLSYLFDFTTGWIYVFGVGVLGGASLREASPTAQARPG